MPEDNVTSIGNQDITPIVKSRLRQVGEQRRQLKQTAEDTSMDNLINGSTQLDAASYNTTNQNLSKDYRKNSQMAAVSYMVKYAANRAGENWTENTVSDIMSKFYTLNNSPEIVNKITDFINSDRDPEEFGIEMGWIPTDTEENMNIIEKMFLTDWRDLKGRGRDVARMVKYPFDTLVQGAYDLGGAKMRDGANTDYYNSQAGTMALDDWAYNKYGKVIGNMSEDEIARVELDLALEMAKNGTYTMGESYGGSYNDKSPYQSSIDRQRYDVGTTELALGGFMAGLELAFPTSTAVLSTIAETPVVQRPLQLLGLIGYGIGDLTTMIPGVSDWVDSLPEDVQEEVRMIGGNTIFALISARALKAGYPYLKGTKFFKNVEGRLNSLPVEDIISTIQKAYNTVKDFGNVYGESIASVFNGGSYKQLKNSVTEANQNIKGGINEGINNIKEKVSPKVELDASQKNKIKQDLRDKLLGKTQVKNLTKEDNASIERSLDRLLDEVGPENISDLENLVKKIGEQKQSKLSSQDKLLGMDTNKYTQNDIRQKTKNEGNPNGYDFVEYILNELEDVHKKLNADGLVSDTMNYLKDIKAKYYREGLTKKEINDILREVTSSIDLYNNKIGKNSGTPLESQSALESARKIGKDFIGNGLDEYLPGTENAFRTLDKAIHDDYVFERNMEQRSNEARGEKAGQNYLGKEGSLKQKTRKILKKMRPFSNKSSIPGVMLEIAKKRGRIDNLSVLDVQEMLNELLTDYNTLREYGGSSNKVATIQKKINNINETINTLIDILEETSETTIKEEKIGKSDLLEPGKSKEYIESEMNDVQSEKESNKNNTEIIKNLQKQYINQFAEILQELGESKKKVAETKDYMEKSLFDDLPGQSTEKK